MRRVEQRRSNAAWALAAVVLLLIAAGLATVAFWPGGGLSLDALSCGGETTTSTVPAATEASTALTTLPGVSTTALGALTTAPPATAQAPGASTSDPGASTSDPSASTTSSAAMTTTTELLPTPPLAFDLELAMSHIEVLAADIGVRKEGSAEEAVAANYAAHYLENLGYAIETADVPLPDGRISRNVWASKAGASPLTIVVGAHLDSKIPSPGANDNASGVAVALELARDLRDADIAATVEFVLFGAEEIIASDGDQHHFGSRQFLTEMAEAERSTLVGMISVDMVGFGSELLVRNMDRGPQLLADLLLTHSAKYGITCRYAKDPGRTGWSDHEPFELAGYPVAWLQWQDDPTYHTADDTFEHCDPQVVRQTGEMLRDFLAGLTDADLWMLGNARMP